RNVCGRSATGRSSAAASAGEGGHPGVIEIIGCARNENAIEQQAGRANGAAPLEHDQLPAMDADDSAIATAAPPDASRLNDHTTSRLSQVDRSARKPIWRYTIHAAASPEATIDAECSKETLTAVPTFEPISVITRSC